MKKLLCLLLSLLIFVFPLFSCSDGVACVSDEMFALDTIIRFTLYDEDEQLCKDVIAQCKSEIQRLENLLSATKESSDVYKINHADGDAVIVSEETAMLIACACDLSGKTDGAFDITIRPLMSAWGFDTKEYKVPDDRMINDALQFVGYENIDIEDNTVKLKHGMSIDLGAIAKGYIGDRVRGVLSDSAVFSAIVDMGGMIITKGEGKTANQSGWNIGLQYPIDSAECFLSFSCTEPVISTSGGYQRYFEQDGVKYHHIIDSSSGRPATSDVSSVTVIGENGYECDALSTAFYVMGTQKTIDFLNTYTQANGKSYMVLMLSQDKKTLYASKEFENNDLNLELVTGYEDIEIVYF